jgi:iron(III) transport system substrate-binding protein
MRKKLTVAASALMGLSLALAACSSGTPAAPTTPADTGAGTTPATSPDATQTQDAETTPATEEVGDLLIYTARAQEVSDYVVEQFEAAHPEYAGKVEVLSMGAADIVNRVDSEKTNPQASFWWGGTAQAFANATTAGLLDPWPDAPFADEIAPEYKDPDGYWYAEYQLPQVILFNSDVLTNDTAPKDWDDLIQPEWADKIVIRDVAPSGGMRTIFTSRILAFSPDGSDPEPGREWLRKLDANTVTYAADPTDLYLQLVRQNGIVSLWNLQDTLIEIETNGQPFGFNLPTSGTPVVIDNIGIVAGAPNPEGAKLFAEFLYDQEIRTTLANDYFQIPVTPIAQEPEWMQGLNIIPQEIDWSVAAKFETEWTEYWAANIKNQG